MPYKSSRQRAFLHVHKPKTAKKWDREGAKVGGGKTAKQKAKRRK
jgi:hypothetical protein